jgi:hypothetical protein
MPACLRMAVRRLKNGEPLPAVTARKKTVHGGSVLVVGGEGFQGPIFAGAGADGGVYLEF